MEVRGAANVPASGPAILVANHESALDPFVLGLVTRRDVHFLAKAELWRFRPLGWFVEALGAVPVERGRGDRDALGRAEAVLRAGGVVAIFPEGAVRREPGAPWLRGGARLALVTGAPLVPVRLLGTGRALAGRRVRFPRLVAVVGDPIMVEPARPTVAGAKALTEKLRAAVAALG